MCCRDSVKPPDFTTPSRRLTPDEIEQYWSQCKNVFSPDKDRFWEGLLAGLNSYLPILQGKKYFIIETGEKSSVYSRIHFFTYDISNKFQKEDSQFNRYFFMYLLDYVAMYDPI